MILTTLLLTLILPMVMAYEDINHVVKRAKATKGIEVKNGQYTFLASIVTEGTHICTGSIVGNDWVITVASCLYYLDETAIPVSELSVLAGSRFWRNGIRHKAFRKVIHDNYKYPSTKSNIALIQTETKFKWDSLLGPIEMNLKAPTEKSGATSCGWGYDEPEKKITRVPGPSSRHLNVQVKISKNVKSSQTYELYVEAAKGGGICSGGFGSALVQNNQLIGVLSYTPPCQSKSHETFTKLQHFADWITNIVSNPLDLKPVEQERKYIARVQEGVFGQFPYIGVMIEDNEHVCSVTLGLQPKYDSYILAPGHCFYDKDGDQLDDVYVQVSVGGEGYMKGPLHDALKVNFHPSYEYGSYKHDLVALKLLQPLPLKDPKVRYLPRQRDFIVDSVDIIVTVVSYASLKGKTLTLGKEFPFYTQMIALSSADCTRYHPFVDDKHFCGLNMEGDGICNVDPGSPVVHNKKIVGIVVTGGACNGIVPQVYMRLSAYDEWLIDFETKSM